MEEEKKGGMGSRGVSRPMSEQKDHHQEHGTPYSEQRFKMLEQHHQKTLWIYWTLILLGIWLVLSPITFSYGKSIVLPAGGRNVWLPIEERILIMKWNDIVCGFLLLFFGWRSLLPNRPISLWICCLVGVWLNFAPLIFWYPSAAAYLNDTLTGVLVISLTILIPGMPNMVTYMEMGPEVPKGWSYNPSSWPQRWILIATGFAGWVVSRYLAAFQLGYIDKVWDPFFGESSAKVLNSGMSHSWPISDAGLGALAYTFEFLMGFMGSASRWRTMPWMVTLFAILVIPLGLVHIFLVISQPIVVGFWCTFCLLAAAIMLLMIPLEVDEVIAMGQYLVQEKRKGKSLWKAFWKGGTVEGEGKDERSPDLIEFSRKPKVLKASFWGMSFPWTLTVSTVIGLFLMFIPGIFDLSGWSSHLYHLTGALIVVTSVISMGEVIRAARYFNIVLALLLIIGPWAINVDLITSNVISSISGILLILLSIPRGVKKESYGLWEKYVK